MEYKVRDASASSDEDNGESPLDAQLREHEDYLRELRDYSDRIVSTHLPAVGFNDISPDWLLILVATFVNNTTARELARRLGMSSTAIEESIGQLVLHGYLKFRNSPRNNPANYRGLSAAITEQGQLLVAEAITGARAMWWAEFAFRSGDIVITTVPKSGTTWMQMICALLIFQTPDLPAPLRELSLHIADNIARGGVSGQLAAQQHRRFMKTHAPLSDMPIDPRVTYIVVARDPLDVLVSYLYQNTVLLRDKNPARPGVIGTSPDSVRQWLLDRIGEMVTPAGKAPSLLDKMLKEMSAAWQHRAEPNVVLVHYNDLSTDLEGEMRRIAGHLGITVSETTWPILVKAATFKYMRAAADRLQPLKHKEDGTPFQDHTSFFRKGAIGEGRALLHSAELAAYHARAARLAPPDLLAWLHRDDEVTLEQPKL